MALLKPIDQIMRSPDFTKETYGFTSTRDIVMEFEKKGWRIASEQNAKVRKLERDGYQKHIIRMRNDAHQVIEGLSKENSSIPELVILNSHDSSSSLQIYFGLIRIACLNGIIAGTGLNSIRLTHSSGIVSKLPDAIDYMATSIDTFKNQIVELQNKKFTQENLNEFIRRSYEARFLSTPYQEISFKMPSIRRMADTGSDAFTIFNRIQEAVLRGGIDYTVKKETIVEQLGCDPITYSVIKHKKTRQVASVTAQVNLNRLVYQNALELAS